MAFALLITTALAAGGFLVTSIQGFLVAGGLASHSAAARFLVTRHVGYAIPTVLLSLFSQSMVIFFFIGTGKLVKEEVAGFPDAERAPVLAALRRFKARTSPAATFALASAIAVFVLGGAVHTAALPRWTHLIAAIAALAIHLWALVVEAGAFADNNRLMENPRAYVTGRLRTRPVPPAR
jgi:hypothetical protein